MSLLTEDEYKSLIFFSKLEGASYDAAVLQSSSVPSIVSTLMQVVDKLGIQAYENNVPQGISKPVLIYHSVLKLGIKIPAKTLPMDWEEPLTYFASRMQDFGNTDILKSL